MLDTEFNALIAETKRFKDKFVQPKINSYGKQALSDKKGNEYIFDYQLGSAGKMIITMEMSDAKQKWQSRFNNMPMVRIDINGSPHMDPTNGRVLKNHIHIFYPSGTKVYAIQSFDTNLYQDLNPWNVLRDFFIQMNIKLSHSEQIQEAF